MQTYLYGFGYESPEQFCANSQNSWDDEDSQTICITANTESEALAWGRQIAEAFLKLLFRDDSVSWADRGYADWIEVSGESSRCGQRVQVGTMPDFTEWLAPYRQKDG